MSASSKHHNHSRDAHAARPNSKRPLEIAIKRQLVGLDASRAVAWQVMKLLVRIEKLFDLIDAAYNGQPFLPGVLPDAPPNRHRFNAFVDNHMRAMKLFWQAIELWMLVFGMKKEVTGRLLVTESIRRAAAKPGRRRTGRER